MEYSLSSVTEGIGINATAHVVICRENNHTSTYALARDVAYPTFWYGNCKSLFLYSIFFFLNLYFTFVTVGLEQKWMLLLQALRPILLQWISFYDARNQLCIHKEFKFLNCFELVLDEKKVRTIKSYYPCIQYLHVSH